MNRFEALLIRLRANQLTVAAVVVWIAAFSAYVAAVGFPTKRSTVVLWVLLAIVALGIRQPRRLALSLGMLWIPFFALLAVYDVLRGSSDGLIGRAHTFPHLDFDRWIALGTTPTKWLQDFMYTPGNPALWDYAAWGVYLSHFLVPLLVGVVLWSMVHPRANQYLLGVLMLSGAALVTYALYPAQPPWMIARDGGMGDVTRIVHDIWRDVGIERAARVFEPKSIDGSRYSNPVAALPSLHAAFPMLIYVVLRDLNTWVRRAAGVYVFAVGFVLVYTAEHFVFDVLLGWLYAVVVAWISGKTLLHMRARRRAREQARTGKQLSYTVDGQPGKPARGKRLR